MILDKNIRLTWTIALVERHIIYGYVSAYSWVSPNTFKYNLKTKLPLHTFQRRISISTFLTYLIIGIRVNSSLSIFPGWSLSVMKPPNGLHDQIVISVGKKRHNWWVCVWLSWRMRWQKDWLGGTFCTSHLLFPKDFSDYAREGFHVKALSPC